MIQAAATRSLAVLWRQRGRRERVLLAGFGVALAGYLIAAGVIQPLVAARVDTLATIARHDAAIAQLAALPNGAVADADRADGPVSAIATETAAEHGLAIRRIEGDEAGTRLEIEDAGFDEIVLWVEALERSHGLRLVAVEMDRRPEPGVVSARLTLER